MPLVTNGRSQAVGAATRAPPRRARRPRRRLGVGRAIAAAALAIRVALPTPAAADAYDLKGAFLYNFAKFIRWPEESFTRPESAFELCIADQTVATDMARVLKDRAVDQRALRVRSVSVADTGGCHILFVPADATGADGAPPRRVGLLTIGEDPTFIPRGGVMNFVLQNNKVRFQLSIDAARDGGLVVGSELLRLADLH